ncbi:probable inactive peptidyl-prolyl cis-trans isomerase-like 6 [Anthonomus grandis grandis]|uniref:probable inactive peptidyl-prolyl cis-trans isomerase-like 6 n=1 Tax=Anthonomus grandis grandis TaxID=2921223 RepID=UPI002165BE14|nr:probable inactive peptidyl-prolyl cis-trans isomerase-like 6 [Anthonomus grandis grandis]
MVDCEEPEPAPYKFLVIGIITSDDFQKCRYALAKLHKSFPKEFDEPDIRPMLDVEWNEFITKYQRRLGNGLWSLKNRVAVFKNGDLLGDFLDLNAFIWKKWKFVFNQNWRSIATDHLFDFLQDKIDHCRQLAYLTIAINNRVIGSLLFELFNDLVPLTCENFMKRCTAPEGGYEGAPIHRVVQSSFIQCGGHNIDPIIMPCENYVVPHNRRGVLSMCNNGRHKDNSTQFFITLASAPWMDYRYVGFGQLIQGENILKALEEVSTYYQAPLKNIRIVKCGEYKISLEPSSSGCLFTVDEIEDWKGSEKQIDIITYLRSLYQLGGEDHKFNDEPTYIEVYKQKGSIDTLLSENKLKQDLINRGKRIKSNTPFNHLPDFSSDDEEDVDFETCGPDYPLKKHKQSIYEVELTPDCSHTTL